MNRRSGRTLAIGLVVASSLAACSSGDETDDAGVASDATPATGVTPGTTEPSGTAPDAPAASDELFGPVASVFKAKDLTDAIQIANGTSFGLGASAWTRDDAERDRFLRAHAARRHRNGGHRRDGGECG